MKLNIKKNFLNGGYICFFKYCNVNYYASLCCTFDRGNECMIFPCKENEEEPYGLEVLYGMSVYQNRYVSVTEEELERCVNEFIRDRERMAK